jgi:hypothetical protein
LVDIASDGSCRAGLPFVKAKKLLTGYYSMPMGSYGGAVSRPGRPSLPLYRRWLEETAELTRERLVVSSPVEIPELVELGFTEKRLAIHMVERPKEGWSEKIWPARTRTKMRRLAGSPLEVRLAQSRSDVQNCFRIAARRGKRNFYTEKYFQHLLDQMAPTGRLLWQLAFLEDELAGFQVYFAFKKELFYWDGGVDKRFSAFNAGYVLFQHVFQEARTKDFSRINLGATPAGALGVRFFKTQLGGREIPVYEYTASSPVKKKLRAAYEKIRRRK